MSDKMKKYLAAGEMIDWDNPEILKKAKDLSHNMNSPEDIVRSCFEFVRDEIMHSNDYKMNPVTCRASDVLKYKTGFCYAKSHLLAALLRANGIPAGLCYQRLTIENNEPPFCLHGLNAVYLQDVGWYRIDARGNKEGIDAEFDPPRESIAFSTVVDGETDFKEIWSEPLPLVTKVLQESQNYLEVAEKLPDIEIL